MCCHLFGLDAIRSQDEFQRLREPWGRMLARSSSEAWWAKPRAFVIWGSRLWSKVVGVAMENEVGLVVLKIASAGSDSAHLAECLTYEIVRSTSCPVLTIRG
jgi:hypothetical protein